MDQATAREELSAIRSLMMESQGFLSGTWPHQLVWGSVGTVGLASTWWALATQRFGLVPWIWAALVAAGWFFSLSRARVGGTQAPVRNVATRAFGGIWMSIGVTLTLLGGLAILTNATDPRALPGLIAIVFGAGYFATGFVSGLRWLQAVALAWWVGGVVLSVWQTPHSLLVLAGMTVLLEVMPALVLRGRELKGLPEAR